MNTKDFLRLGVPLCEITPRGLGKSQRDFFTQPRVATKELPWVTVKHESQL
jgi:hypothetical protein